MSIMKSVIFAYLVSVVNITQPTGWEISPLARLAWVQQVYSTILELLDLKIFQSITPTLRG